MIFFIKFFIIHRRIARMYYFLPNSWHCISFVNETEITIPFEPKVVTTAVFDFTAKHPGRHFLYGKYLNSGMMIEISG